MKNKSSVKRLPNWQDWSEDRIMATVSARSEIQFEELEPSIEVELDLPLEIGKNREIETEATLAIAIHELLAPVRKANPALLKDNGFWMWLGLGVCQEQIVDRWCGGRSPSGGLRLPNGASYFISGDSLVKQSRCGVRRLWIAADISQRCEGDYSHTLGLLASRDLFTGITERMVGLDAEMAIELMLQLSAVNRPVNGLKVEDFRRLVLRKVSVVMSTVAIELLNRRQKSELIKLVIQEMNSSPIPEPEIEDAELVN